MDTFCVLPWFGQEIIYNLYQTPCCLLPIDHDLTTVKKDLIEGRQSPACQKCWNLENNGLKSNRQLKNETFDFFTNRNLSNIKQDAEKGNTSVQILTLSTSNTCNSTCVSCNEAASSSWANLNSRLHNLIPVKHTKSIDIEKTKNTVDFKNLKMLSLLGGEPLYEKKNFELLDYLLDLGNDKVFLSMVTNGSVKLSDRQKKTLSKFENLNFSLSIDGTESVFEYMRFPLKWLDLNVNLKFFKDITANISSNYTLSNLNILYHNETTKWFDQNKMVFTVNPVYRPTWLQPRALSADIKQVLEKTLNKSDYHTFIGSTHTDLDQQNFETMLKNIQLQDDLKRISINDYLPEFVKMF